ncbi:MAG: hypothetical protein L0154_16740 [Chloroflexi bacterium]|nr:hypothetical protein [Chloroflexota bacterium]
MIKFFTVVFGLLLVVLFGSMTFSRRSESTAFWILTRQSTNQPRQYNYILSLPDGRAPRPIATPAGTTDNSNWFIDWLPDTNTIFYLNQDVYALNIRSGKSQRIIESTGTIIGFDTLLSPDGDWLLMELRNSVNTHLFRIETNRNTAHLIAEILSVTSNMTWSDDGSTIYFINFVNDRFRPLASDGRSITEVTWGQRFEQFSSDGTQKAYYAQDAPNVWQIETLATGSVTPLTQPDKQYRLVNWFSNDWIVLEEIPDRTSFDYDNTQRYFRVRPDGSEFAPLFVAKTSFSNQIMPFWTDQWFYVNSLDGENESLHRVNIETGKSQRIIADFLPFTINEVVNFYDGTARTVRLLGDWIIWRTPGENTRIMQTRLDGTDTRKVYDVPASARTPELISSPDNEWLYIAFFDRQGAWSVDRVHLLDGTVEKMYNSNHKLIAISPIVDRPLQLYWSGLLVILTGAFLILFFK